MYYSPCNKNPRLEHSLGFFVVSDDGPYAMNDATNARMA